MEIEKILDYYTKIAKDFFLYMGFGEDEIRVIIDSFQRDLSKELDKLQSSSNDSDIRDTLHALKGLLRNIGAEKKAMEIEKIYRQESQIQKADIEKLFEI